METDYRVQGFDLTDGHLDGQFNVTYDSASGIYGGASAIFGETAGGGVHPLAYLGDIGFAKRMASDVNWDVGLSDAQLALYVPATRPAPGATVYSNYSKVYMHRYDLDYAEVYGGVSTAHLSAHLYISPDYLGQDLRTAYLDVDGAIRPLEHLRLFGHLGALAPLGGASALPGAHQGRLDVSAGAAWEALWGELKITFSATTPRLPYPVDYDQHRGAVSLSLSHFF